MRCDSGCSSCAALVMQMSVTSVICFLLAATAQGQGLVFSPQGWGWGDTPAWPGWWRSPWQGAWPTQQLPPELWDSQCECGLPGTSRFVVTARHARQEDGAAPEISDRIVGGEAAEAHQFPWLVLLLVQSDPVAASSLWCGGAIISSRYVLTAAHCVRGLKTRDLKVVVGLHDRCVSEHTSATISVVSAEYPADFESKYLSSDIALLRLSMKLSFSNVVRPICMPRPGAAYWGSAGEIAGWGKVGYGNASGSCVLLRAQVPVLSHAACAESKYKERQITRTHFCAGDIERGGVDTCQGDSGGPLAIPRLVDGRYELVGVVSGGNGCALPGYPGLYTRVSDFLPWLAERMQDAPFCIRRSPNYNLWQARSKQ